MTMVAGSVTVFSDETAFGTGLAAILYMADVATVALPTVPSLGDTTAPFAPGRACTAGDITVMKAARMTILQELARRANAYASIAPYVTGHAVATIVVSAGGLQTTPTPNNPGVATAAPGSPVTLTGSIT